MNDGNNVYPKIFLGCTILGLSYTLMRRTWAHNKNQIRQTPSKDASKRKAVVATHSGRCKTVHFVRHAEGVHNEAYHLYGHVIDTMERFFDAQLTVKGKEQCAKAQRVWAKRDHPDEIELLVVSPLQRCLETATQIFGQYRSAVPWIALEEIRERAGKHPCDRRRPTAVVRKEFPHVDFSQVCDEEDIYWGDGNWRESNEDMYPRIWKFLEWLAAIPEKNIIVVSHSAFLSTMFNQVLDADNSLRKWFENCEIRTVILSFDSESTPES